MDEERRRAWSEVILYPLDRARLLESGFMCMNVYSSSPVDETTRESYRCMRSAAELMGLRLTEPILAAGPLDSFGGRMVSTTAGVIDALKKET